MDLKEEIEKLEKKIDDNAIKIISNYNQINNNVNKINDNQENIKRNSFALEMLKDYKTENKKVFTILIIVLVMWFITIGYLVYVLNDIGTIEETTQEVTQENENGNNNFIGNDGVIDNG